VGAECGTEGNYSNVGHRGPVYKGLGAMNPTYLMVLLMQLTPYSLRGTKWVSMYNVRIFVIQEGYRKSIFARSQNCEKRILASSCLSVRIFIKFYMSIFRKQLRKIQTSLKPEKHNGYYIYIYLLQHLAELLLE
jgi:hypothetical protein